MTLSDAERARRVAELVNEETAQPTRWWWVSFADPQRATGQQFLGVAIVEARGLISAVRETHRRGCNPGGSVAAYLLDDDKVPPAELRNRLLSRDELIAAELIQADPPRDPPRTRPWRYDR